MLFSGLSFPCFHGYVYVIYLTSAFRVLLSIMGELSKSGELKESHWVDSTRFQRLDDLCSVLLPSKCPNQVLSSGVTSDSSHSSLHEYLRSEYRLLSRKLY
jgi:hypothetical protein